VLELVPLAIDAVNAAFRVGLVVSDAVDRIVPAHDLDQSWSFIIPDRDADKSVKDFSEKSVRFRRGAILKSYLTICRSYHLLVNPT
jgi:hypothetical protein